MICAATDLISIPLHDLFCWITFVTAALALSMCCPEMDPQFLINPGKARQPMAHNHRHGLEFPKVN